MSDTQLQDAVAASFECYEQEITALRQKLEEAERERDEARQFAGLGCEAADGGPHSIIKQGNYSFCHKCGCTIKAPTLHERARSAEARATALAEENARRRTALKPFADDAERLRNYPDDYPYSFPVTRVTVGHFRAARSALRDGQGGETA